MRHINKIASRLRLLSCVKLVNCCSLIVDTPGLPTHFEGYEVKPELIDGSKLRFIGPDLHDKWKIYILKGDEWVRYMRPISSGMLEGFIKNHYEKIHTKVKEEVMVGKNLAASVTKYNMLMLQITAMSPRSIFTIVDLVEALEKVGAKIDEHTIYNYLEPLIQAGYGLRKMRPVGKKRSYYQVTTTIPIGISTSQARDEAKKLIKLRGGKIITEVVNYTPVRKVLFDDSKAEDAIKYYSSLPTRKSWSSVRKKAVGRKGLSLFDSMYYTLLGLDKGCIFVLEDLRSLLAGQQVHINKPAQRQYMDILFRANCGIDKRKTSHVLGRIFYLISDELPPKTDDLTLSFFKELGKGARRKIEYVDYPIRVEMKFKDDQLKAIWESICDSKVPGDDKLEESISRLEEEELDSSFLDRQDTDEDLGRQTFTFLTRQMQRIEQLQARVEELENAPDLRLELESRESEIKKLNETITDRFVRITDLEKEVRQVRGESTKKSVRIAELESYLKKAKKDSDTMTIAERMKALKEKVRGERL